MFSPPRSNLSQASPSPQEDYDDEAKNREKHDNLGGWSFIQALTPSEINGSEKIYVHPMEKNTSSSILSKKSLEMCTENLGSESGSEGIIEELIFHQIGTSTKIQELNGKKKEKMIFPPPISSIRGSDIVQVLPHREGGRLLIKTVMVNSNNGYFQAERCNGRLRLSLLTESDDTDDENEDHDQDEDEDEECEIGISTLINSCKEEDGNGNGKEVMSNWGPFLVGIS
ncbi:protein FANTASTIC FOUR 3-like [Impatiens glandulifera]|uniref:protein FANTASTIC FOUR 3-like n=1 Tax=Impatiens glandulifera TaxID=253017 RepID=UPI001FB0C121|nr:protein FANTASTIC FOUR 3-like [Impatiens glandulifera]